MRSSRSIALILATLCALSARSALCDGTPSGSEVNRLASLEESESDFAVALAAHRRGDFDIAVLAYQQAIEKDPGFVEAHVNLARALSDQGLQTEAEGQLDRAMRTHRDQSGIHKVRGLVALRRGEPALAVESLTRARELRPEDPEILTNLGAALIAQQRTTAAIGVLERSLDLEPSNPSTALNLGLAHDLASDAGRAAYHYHHFLDLSQRDDPLREDVQHRLDLLLGSVPNAVSAAPKGAR